MVPGFHTVYEDAARLVNGAEVQEQPFSAQDPLRRVQFNPQMIMQILPRPEGALHAGRLRLRRKRHEDLPVIR